MNKKQTVFVNEYLKCWNAAEAARRAGYSERTARSIGYENLTKPDIAEAIQQRLSEVQMSADEALTLLADIARGDMGELMDVYSTGFNLDMKKAKDAGLTKLIKKVKQKTTTFIAKKESDEDREVTELEVELYAADAAIDKVLRVHGRYKDVGTKDNPLTIEKDDLDNERFDRAISSLADAIREVIPGEGASEAGEVDTAE